MNRQRQFTYRTAPGETLSVQELLKSKGYSRRLIIDVKQIPDGLLLNGKAVTVTASVSPKDTLTVTLPPETPSSAVTPTPMKLQIVYQDEDLMVVNKASGVPIHPSQGNHGNSLADGMAWYFDQKGEPFTFRVINRLDKDTTGLLILAKHALSASILSRMVSRGQIYRTYLAAVSGDLRRLADMDIPGLFCSDSESGMISAPIARTKDSTIKREVNFTDGEDAVTHYQILGFQKDLNISLVRLKLETGRTHQIRVHFQYLGYPLLGDFLYNPDYSLINRQSLHSWKLAFSHPITKEPLTFTAAVPDDMKIFTDEVLLDSDF